jgi:beta-phosphoglucomutase-like phosphatase (HAD superfamily)
MGEKKNVFLLMFRAARGCLSRVGIVQPKVTITADDPRLRAGKRAPDPFLLAAECLGYRASRCVVFEDSPSGIRAGVAAGAIVVAVCTSHSRGQIEECGAHFVVENLDDVRCEEIKTDEGTRLMSTVEH